MKKTAFKFLQFLVCLSLLTFVAWQAGLLNAEGRAGFAGLLLSVNGHWLVAAFAVGVLVNMSSALKWWMLATARQLRAGYWRVFCYYLIGQFYNLFLPTSVGGDVVRAWQLGRFSGRQADALASVFVERYTGILVLLLLAGLALLSQLTMFGNQLVYASLLFFTLVLAFIAWVIFDPRLYQSVRRRSLRVIPKTAFVFAKLDTLLASIKSYTNHPLAIGLAFLNSLMFYFLAVVNVYITARVFAVEVSFLDIMIATPIIMLIMNIPFSIGNFGWMESGYSVVFMLMGYSPALGLAVAALMRVKSLFDGAVGGVLQARFIQIEVPKEVPPSAGK